MTVSHITIPTIIMRGHAEQRTLAAARAKQHAAKKRVQQAMHQRGVNSIEII